MAARNSRSFHPKLELLERRESPTSLGDLVPLLGPLNSWLDPWSPFSKKKEDGDLGILGGTVFEAWNPSPEELPDGYYAAADVSLDDGSPFIFQQLRRVDLVQVATLSYASPSEWVGFVIPTPPRLPPVYEVDFYTSGIYAVRDRTDNYPFSAPIFIFIDAPSAAYDGAGDGGQVRREGLYQFFAVPGPYDLIAVAEQERDSKFLDIASGFDNEKTVMIRGARHFGLVVREASIRLNRPVNVILVGLAGNIPGSVRVGRGELFTPRDGTGSIAEFAREARQSVSSMKIITDFLGDSYVGRQDTDHVYSRVTRAVYNGQYSVTVGGWTGPARVVKETTGFYFWRTAVYQEHSLPALPQPIIIFPGQP
ncbi:MAG: hypothetical protein Q8R32_01475 [bacterium]|nr:hypothetical protein [bacterium]